MTLAGWAGSVREFLATDNEVVLEHLKTHQVNQLGMGSAGAQVAAWREQISILKMTLSDCAQQMDAATEWSLILEYELPLEGGRRPDAVMLTGSSVAVLEFKQASRPVRAHVDQAESYARDLADYHGGTHGRHVLPILVLTRGEGIAVDFDPVVISGPGELSHFLLENASAGSIELAGWLAAPYEPLPTLVAAARRIFQHKPLPHVHAALAEDIPGTLRTVGELVAEAEQRRERKLVLVTGVPGSGKTLVGLRLVYEQAEARNRGILLSGNGPLVQVLQDALESRVFVRDLHAYIRSNGINGRTPSERIVVFDEAQRAWDRAFMYYKRHVETSEPEFLVDIGERIKDWAVLVGLVGQGQEIYSGEEAGIGQWRDAILAASADTWRIHVPPTLLDAFDGCHVTAHTELELTVPLRSRRAQILHDWVSHLLSGNLAFAARLANRMDEAAAAFPIYLTRDLDTAKSYARARYSNEPDRRYGLMVAAHARVPRRYGIDNHFMAMSKLKVGRWFNASPDDPQSCCALTEPVTEFQVQGLEIDLPIVCWGEDYLWTGSGWLLRPARSRYPQLDSGQLLTNAYRVLLTRGRDGLVIFVPPEKEFDLTEHALLAAGVRPLDQAEGELDRAVQGEP